MKFTDDDLKRLKAECDFHGPAEQCVELIPQDLLNLIARLEAAEEAAKDLPVFHNFLEESGELRHAIWANVTGCDMCKRYSAWRKVSGRDSDGLAGK